MRLKVRSLVGLLPLAAVAVFEQDMVEKLPNFRQHAVHFLKQHPELAANLHMPATPGLAGRRLLSVVNEQKLRRILSRMLDENEFFVLMVSALSPATISTIPSSSNSAARSTASRTCRATRACR